MSIRRRKGSKKGILQIDLYSPSGERYTRSAKTADRARAKELHNRIEADLWRQEQLGEQPVYSWGQAVTIFLADRQKLRDLDSIKHMLEVLTGFIGNKTPITMLAGKNTVTMIKVKLREPRERRYSATRVQTYNISDARLNKYLTYFGAVLKSVGQKAPIDFVSTEDNSRVVWITREQADALLLQLPDHLAPMVRFSLATGLRQNNVTHLQWAQFDEPLKLVWINASQSKNKKPLGIPLNRDAMMVLQAQRGKHDQWVFPYRRHTKDEPGKTREKGGPVDQPAGAAWQKACLRAELVPGKVAGLQEGEQFFWHALRHTWATWHVRAGTPLPVLQKLGGWSSINMVLRYAHFAPDHIAAFADNVMQAQDQMLKVVK